MEWASTLAWPHLCLFHACQCMCGCRADVQHQQFISFSSINSVQLKCAGIASNQNKSYTEGTPDAEDAHNRFLPPRGGKLCRASTLINSETVAECGSKTSQCGVKDAAGKTADFLRRLWDNKVKQNASNADETELMRHDQ